jgi:hypothetical protein
MAELRRDQIEALRRWIAAREEGVPGWVDHPALGRSYVDSRQRGGRTYHARRAYVALDHSTARLVPELAGRSGDEIKAILAELKE